MTSIIKMFGADWCEKCHRDKHRLEKYISQLPPTITFKYIDWDNDPEGIARKKQISVVDGLPFYECWENGVFLEIFDSTLRAEKLMKKLIEHEETQNKQKEG